MGKTNTFQGVILIKAIFPEDVLRDTLLHELIHACFGTSRADQYAEKVENVEEWVCNTQTPVLLSLFRDNPKIRKYLFEEK